jgi:hypothetical protein
MFPSDDVVIYGEAYGGCIQKKGHMYGTKQKFVAFDVWMGTQKKMVDGPRSRRNLLEIEDRICLLSTGD